MVCAAVPMAFTFPVPAGFHNKGKQEDALRNVPDGQQVHALGSCCSPCLHNYKIMTKVNIWGQVYFGQTTSSLVSKIRNSAGYTWFGHPARELCLRDVQLSCLLFHALSPLLCLSIDAEPPPRAASLCMDAPAQFSLSPHPQQCEVC